MRRLDAVIRDTSVSHPAVNCRSSPGVESVIVLGLTSAYKVFVSHSCHPSIHQLIYKFPSRTLLMIKTINGPIQIPNSQSPRPLGDKYPLLSAEIVPSFKLHKSIVGPSSG